LPVLTIVLVFALAGCGGEDQATKNTSGSHKHTKSSTPDTTLTANGSTTEQGTCRAGTAPDEESAAKVEAATKRAMKLCLLPSPPSEDSAEAGFARDMFVHHAQAVQMAEIVRDRTQSDAMRLLASDISLNQQAQIGIMQSWLQVWAWLPSGTEPAMAWMGHPMNGPMPGMASPQERDRLYDLPPNTADVLFLRLMIVHHQAAIPMAEAIVKRTDEPYVRQLAHSIVVSQRAEIENMKAMIEAEVGDSAEVHLEPQNGSVRQGRLPSPRPRGRSSRRHFRSRDSPAMEPPTWPTSTSAPAAKKKREEAATNRGP
jgi:uncharacterized protein (DUF305 family)